MRSLLLILCFSPALFAQLQKQSSNINFDQHVEAYYDNTIDRPVYIYDQINGKIIDTLKNTNNKNSWYKIAIAESEYGWFKIKNIQRLPDQYKNFGYENHWVKASNFMISIDVFSPISNVYIYDQASEKSNRIHRIDSFQVAEITETNDLWALIHFKVGKKTVSGWLGFKHQCALPWTTCHNY